MELELFTQFWQVLFVEIEGIGVSANVKQSIRQKLIWVPPESVVEEISVLVELEQVLPLLQHVHLQLTHRVHLQLASVENCCYSCNLILVENWLHSIVLAEILQEVGQMLLGFLVANHKFTKKEIKRIVLP